MPVSKLRVTKGGVFVALLETSSTPEELKAERYASQDVVIEQLDADGNVVATSAPVDEAAEAAAAEAAAAEAAAAEAAAAEAAAAEAATAEVAKNDAPNVE